ncbi:MAG: ribonuclease P protein component [Parachlamydiaceae bacterium]
MTSNKDCTHPKSARLRTRWEYQRLAHRSIRRAGKLILIDVCPNRSSSIRLGITASRHYGIAVKRNRFKRVVREAFRLTKQRLPKGIDINVKPRPLAHNAKTSDIIEELLFLLEHSSFSG